MAVDVSRWERGFIEIRECLSHLYILRDWTQGVHRGERGAVFLRGGGDGGGS